MTENRLPSTSLLVVDQIDGTHMGPAVNWWCAQVDGDAGTIETIQGVVGPEEMIRSALEVVLSQVVWIARNDRESWCDSGVRYLNELSRDIWVKPSIRAVAAALAAQLCDDPEPSRLTIPAVPVRTVMSLVLLVSRTIELRFDLPVSDQAEVFRRQVLTTAC